SVYGSALETLALGANFVADSNLVATEDVTLVAVDSEGNALTNVSDAGVYAVKATITNDNFVFANGTKELSIANAYEITAREVAVEKSYTTTYNAGVFEKAFEYTVPETGHVISVEIATAGKNAGTYVYGNANEKGIVLVQSISDGINAIANSNYDVSYDVHVEIEQKVVDVQLANDANKPTSTYGTLMSLADIKALYLADKGGALQTEASSALTFAYANDLSATANAGKYDLSASLDPNGNFKFEDETYVAQLSQAYEITQKQITYTYSASVLYEATNNYGHSEVISNSADLLAGHRLEISVTMDENVAVGIYTFEGQYTGVGAYENFAEISASVIGDENVTGNYKIMLDVTYHVSDIAFTANNCDKEYDGNAYGIVLNVQNVDASYTIEYSTDEVEWSAVAPTYTQVTGAAKTVYFKITKTVSADESVSVSGRATVTIRPRQISVAAKANASLVSTYGEALMTGEQLKSQFDISLVNSIDSSADQTLIDQAGISFAIEDGAKNADNYDVVAKITSEAIGKNFVFANGNSQAVFADVYTIEKAVVKVMFEKELYTSTYGENTQLSYVFSNVLPEDESVISALHIAVEKDGEEYIDTVLLDAKAAYEMTIASIEGTQNYNFDIEDASTIVKVDKRTITIAKASVTTGTYGEEVSPISVNSFNVQLVDITNATVLAQAKAGLTFEEKDVTTTSPTGEYDV
ncbi:MAG: hypothetical protein IJV77_03020, partial [Clostridia bacterium]|nr:hypothetical protein [Clostridia bacterium]